MWSHLFAHLVISHHKWASIEPAADFDLKLHTVSTDCDDIGKQTQVSQFCLFSTPRRMWLGKYPLIGVSFNARSLTSRGTYHVKISDDYF